MSVLYDETDFTYIHALSVMVVVVVVGWMGGDLLSYMVLCP